MLSLLLTLPDSQQVCLIQEGILKLEEVTQGAILDAASGGAKTLAVTETKKRTSLPRSWQVKKNLTCPGIGELRKIKCCKINR